MSYIESDYRVDLLFTVTGGTLCGSINKSISFLKKTFFCLEISVFLKSVASLVYTKHFFSFNFGGY